MRGRQERRGEQTTSQRRGDGEGDRIGIGDRRAEGRAHRDATRGVDDGEYRGSLPPLKPQMFLERLPELLFNIRRSAVRSDNRGAKEVRSPM